MKRFTQTLLLLHVLVVTASISFAVDNPAFTDLSQEGLRDVKGPVSFPPNYVLFIIVILLLLIGGIVLLLRFLRRKKEDKEEIPVDTRTAWEIAYEQFNELEKSTLLEDGQFKMYYSQLSGIIRKYFENRFKIRAPEMTTEEFFNSLEKSDDLTEDQKAALNKFLSSCDIVKFAKYIPGLEEGRTSFQFARELVDSTKGADEQNIEPANNPT